MNTIINTIINFGFYGHECFPYKARNKFFKLGKFNNLEVKIGALSNGYGYTSPMAIKKLEDAKIVKTEVLTVTPNKSEDTKALAEEVRNALLIMQEKKDNQLYGSRAEAFIAGVKDGTIQAPLSLKIIRRMQEVAQSLDAIFLAGGEDIPPCWYEDQKDEEIYNQYRSLAEFSMVNEAKNRGIPIMGVCRGFQIFNVYDGKKLEKKVRNPGGVQQYELIDKDQKGLLASIFKEKLFSNALHDQGVSYEEGMNGKGDLEPLTQADGLIKAVESKYPGASPLIGTQFHPEIYSPKNSEETDSPNNETFFTVFFQGAGIKQLKRQITPDLLYEAKLRLKKTNK